MEIEVSIDEEVLAKAVEKTIRPIINTGVLEDANREGFQHQKMLPTAQPCLTREAIEDNPVENVSRAIGAGTWLLSQYELMFAKTFLDRCDADDCRRHCLDLLHGAGDLESRIRSFHDWSEVRLVEETGDKSGINPTAISYLLAVVDPQRYAFCKPSVYKAAAKALLGHHESDRTKRILHSTAFYQAALKLFREKYQLPFGDLLHVHIAFFMVRAYEKDYPGWTGLDEQEPGTGPPPTDDLDDLLLSRKNVVLYGPPGTGKTYRALELAKKWKAANGEESVDQLTFHPSCSYEDFIEGYRPDEGGKFGLRDGLLVQVSDKARSEPDRNFLLLIDEINRGDVARILGELITLIEADKRCEAAASKLPYSQKSFWVPPNLHLLGTMNTADRSISLMDIAIRRRFCFREFRPDPEVFAESPRHLREVEGISLGNLLVGMNKRLVDAGVDRDRAIGHSYFLIPTQSPQPLTVLRDKLRYDVLPLIEEYCYADRPMMRRVVGDLVDDQGEFDYELLDDDDRLVKVLGKLADLS